MVFDVECWVDSHVTSHEMDKVALEQIPPPPANHHSIHICHCPLRCALALTRQRIVTSSAFKLGGFISDLALG
jgi:hypothetical protein